MRLRIAGNNLILNKQMTLLFIEIAQQTNQVQLHYVALRLSHCSKRDLENVILWFYRKSWMGV